MTHAPPPSEHDLRALLDENRALRAELERYHQRDEGARARRGQALGFTWRVLVPIFDRQRVVRSFSQLARTTSELAGPTSSWPTRERMLDDARTFMESCVRFVVRRRLLLIVFSLVAATIPAIQLWLVVQQNRIIENQNEFFAIQVHDIVARSMTEADPNARRIAGGLLAQSEPAFLAGVVEEVFDPGAWGGAFSDEDVHNTRRRLEDAAFRGHLLRAVAHSIERRAADGADRDGLLARSRPMLQLILSDTAARLPVLLRLGSDTDDIRRLAAEPQSGRLLEETDHYIYQLAGLLGAYARLAREAGEMDPFFADVRPLLARAASRRDVDGSRFAGAYRYALETLLFELALAPKLTAPDIGERTFEAAGLTPDQAWQKGFEALRAGVGQDALDWGMLSAQLKGS